MFLACPSPTYGILSLHLGFQISLLPLCDDASLPQPPSWLHLSTVPMVVKEAYFSFCVAFSTWPLRHLLCIFHKGLSWLWCSCEAWTPFTMASCESPPFSFLLRTNVHFPTVECVVPPMRLPRFPFLHLWFHTHHRHLQSPAWLPERKQELVTVSPDFFFWDAWASHAIIIIALNLLAFFPSLVWNQIATFFLFADSFPPNLIPSPHNGYYQGQVNHHHDTMLHHLTNS